MAFVSCVCVAHASGKFTTIDGILCLPCKEALPMASVRFTDLPAPRGVLGFHERDPRRVSAAGPVLRGRVPRPDGGGAPRWETPASSPVYGVQKLSPPNTSRSAVLHPRLHLLYLLS